MKIEAKVQIMLHMIFKPCHFNSCKQHTPLKQLTFINQFIPIKYCLSQNREFMQLLLDQIHLDVRPFFPLTKVGNVL